MRPVPLARHARGRLLAAAALTAALCAALLAVVSAPRATAADALLSQGKPVTVSSTENAGTPGSAAVDGNTGTRWSSAFSDPQWIQVDLGATATVSSVTLNWETAYATAFKLQTSPDGTAWTDVYSTTTGTGGTQTLNVSGSGRYVRMYGTARSTGYGYSLWEFQVYGSTGGGTTNPGGTPISQYARVSASSVEGGNAPAAAVDGRTTTRWSSLPGDDQWLQVDLGGPATMTSAVLIWENAYGTAYRLETSDDAATWRTV